MDICSIVKRRAAFDAARFFSILFNFKKLTKDIS